MRILLGALWVFSILFTSPSFAFDCSTDCHQSARFTYPCPTFRNPGRKCTGRDPVTFGTCSTAKELSCKTWESVSDWYGEKVRSVLEGEFNATKYAHAVRLNRKDEYLAYCYVAAAAACGVVGAEIGGVYGAMLSGAVSTFINRRICDQSTLW